MERFQHEVELQTVSDGDCSNLLNDASTTMCALAADEIAGNCYVMLFLILAILAFLINMNSGWQWGTTADGRRPVGHSVLVVDLQRPDSADGLYRGVCLRWLDKRTCQLSNTQYKAISIIFPTESQLHWFVCFCFFISSLWRRQLHA